MTPFLQLLLLAAFGVVIVLLAWTAWRAHKAEDRADAEMERRCAACPRPRPRCTGERG